MQGKSISLSVLSLNGEKTNVRNIADLVLLCEELPPSLAFGEQESNALSVLQAETQSGLATAQVLKLSQG